MARAGDELVDPITGERMIFRKTAKETDGELLQLDRIGKAGWKAAVRFTSTLTRRSALRSSPAPRRGLGSVRLSTYGVERRR